jgi:hypothetical protein
VCAAKLVPLLLEKWEVTGRSQIKGRVWRGDGRGGGGEGRVAVAVAGVGSGFCCWRLLKAEMISGPGSKVRSPKEIVFPETADVGGSGGGAPTSGPACRRCDANLAGRTSGLTEESFDITGINAGVRGSPSAGILVRVWGAGRWHGSFAGSVSVTSAILGYGLVDLSVIVAEILHVVSSVDSRSKPSVVSGIALRSISSLSTCRSSAFPSMGSSTLISTFQFVLFSMFFRSLAVPSVFSSSRRAPLSPSPKQMFKEIGGALQLRDTICSYLCPFLPPPEFRSLFWAEDRCLRRFERFRVSPAVTLLVCSSSEVLPLGVGLPGSSPDVCLGLVTSA